MCVVIQEYANCEDLKLASKRFCRFFSGILLIASGLNYGALGPGIVLISIDQSINQENL